jgi:hypothetical protein
VNIPVSNSETKVPVVEQSHIVPKTKLQNKVIRFFKDWYILIFTGVIISVATAGGITFLLTSDKASGKASSDLASSSSTSQQETPTQPLPSPTPTPVMIPNPLTGVMMTEDQYKELTKNKVLTVMIENLAGANGARPQSGLTDADIVYDLPVEGNIDRYMAVYWSKGRGTGSDPTVKLMPVRSARKAYIDLLQEYDKPLYMHIGYAESPNPEADAIGALYKYAINDISGSVNSFSRDKNCEAIKSTEHCAYSDTANLWQLAQSRGLTGLGKIDAFTYKNDNETDPNASVTREAKKVSVGFEEDFANYGTTWTYDAATNTSLRNQGASTPLVDTAGKQVSAKVLVIEKTDVSVLADGKYHKVIRTLGSGSAWIIQDGKATEATWKKDTYTSRTKYYDRVTGKELSLNRGNLWIMITSQTPTFG